jgi:NitT/TauT family transport system substrate-binding protein
MLAGRVRSTPVIGFSATVGLAAAVSLTPALAQQPAGPAGATVKVALAKSVSNGSILIAQARGYFKNAGIDLDLQDIDTTADALTLVAQNQIQIVGGGISAGYFNAIDRGLPVTIVSARVATPVGHNLMLRPDLVDSIKTLKDLKGKTIASNGPGSISTYEIGKMLAPAGLSLDDVNIKIFPFTQYAIAFTQKAVDAALVIPPWTGKFADEKIAVLFGDADKLVEPRPVTISVNYMNTDWLKKNPEIAKRYTVAYMKGVRDWCQGYHGAPVRKEIIDLLIKTKVETRPEILNGFWTARPVDGRVGTASLMDIQDFYLKAKMTKKTFPIEALVDHSLVDAATKELGAFELAVKDSPLDGCK